DLADPVRRVAGHSCDGRGGQSTRQQPKKPPVATLDWIVSPATALLEVMFGQIGLEAEASWHASDIWNPSGERGRGIVIVLGSGVDLRGDTAPGDVVDVPVGHTTAAQEAPGLARPCSRPRRHV